MLESRKPYLLLQSGCLLPFLFFVSLIFLFFTLSHFFHMKAVFHQLVDVWFFIIFLFVTAIFSINACAIKAINAISASDYWPNVKAMIGRTDSLSLSPGSQQVTNGNIWLTARVGDSSLACTAKWNMIVTAFAYINVVLDRDGNLIISSSVRLYPHNSVIGHALDVCSALEGKCNAHWRIFVVMVLYPLVVEIHWWWIFQLRRWRQFVGAEWDDICCFGRTDKCGVWAVVFEML